MRGGKFIVNLLLCLVLVNYCDAQELPSKIRGYPVYKAQITASEKDPTADALITLNDPLVKDVSPAGMTIEITAEIKAAKQSGVVDFLVFHNLQVNGIAIEAAEYREPFTFKKGMSVELPKAAAIFIPTAKILPLAAKELTESKKLWIVTGRVFVFGKFRKYGFEHKRVVPIDFSLTIANPIQA